MAILPPKVMSATITAYTPIEYLDNASDIYNGYPYRWQADVSVILQTHSNPNTSTPYYYTAYDIKVGDWISSAVDGSAYEIIEIISILDQTSVTLVIEDIDMFNTYNDQTQSGSGSPTTTEGVIFSLDNDGNPILMGLEPGILSETFATDLISRFNYRNIQQKFIRVNQPGHTFVIGDIIQPNVSVAGTYMLSTGTQSQDLSVGIVSDVGTPNADWFNFEASGEVVYNVTPSLVGSYSSLFYLDPEHPGKITSIRPAEFARPIYLRLNSATTAIKFHQEVGTSETKNYKVPSLTEGQTTFNLPSDAFEIISMSVNGVEVDFTFTNTGSLVTAIFNSIDNGYGIDTTDEVKFIYTT
jgi:hypothetical protein